MPTDRVEVVVKVPEFYSLRCHHRCQDIDDGRFSTLAEAQDAGRDHYGRTGHVGVIHAVIPISLFDLGVIPGIVLPRNGLRSEPW